jgi:hypothetical protein
MTLRRTIATTERYDEAEAVVDRLADGGFPVEHVSIVGRDLQYVERVIGRLTAWKAALGGAAPGLGLGLLLGALSATWLAHDGTSMLAILAYWALFGAGLGAAVALLGYVLEGGRRSFASVADMRAQQFDVVVDEQLADDAIARTAGVVRRPDPIS